MSSLGTIVATTALLCSALIGGVFFAFSSFVMKALARLPSSEGIAAMQSINIVVINRSFLSAFMGTAILSLGIGGSALFRWADASSIFFLGGSVSYVVGTFLVTVVGNVPLNNELAAVSAADSDAKKVWMRYLERWTMWNHIRTMAAMLAALLYTAGLIQIGGA